MTGRAPRRLAAALLLFAGLVDILLVAVPNHPLRLGWDAVPAYGWSRYALTAAGVACVAAAPAVARARREARWVGLAAASLSMAVAIVHDADLAAIVPSAIALAGLAAAGRMPGRSDPRLARSALRVLLVGEAAVLVYAAVGLYLLDANFQTSTSAPEALEGAVRLVFLLPPAAIQPATDHGAWFIDSIRWLSALTLGAACVTALAPSLSRERRRNEAERAEQLLERWGSSALAPFHLLDDKHWCFSEDGNAFVGYALSGATAVALGGPVGAPASKEAALRAFLDTCARHAWAPAFHQVDEGEAAALRARGLRVMKIGEEAVVPLAGFTLSGKPMKTIRQAISRAEREGLTVSEQPRPISDDAMAELREVSDAWLSSSGHRERGFTLGAFDPDALRDAPVLVVRDSAGRAVAFANVIPSYQGTVGNFDLMRRVPDAPAGTIELLFVSLIERFREEGMEGMSLGLAPLAGIEGGGILPRVLAAVQERSTFMNFAGLESFKAKWRPRWEPRYFAYSGAGDLPRAAAATALAGEHPGRGRSRAALVRTARRFPASLGLGLVLLWVMAATSGDPAYHTSLVDRAALSWGDLTTFHWWRVPLSALVQEDVGFAWPIIALLPALPAAEARLGWRRTLLIFFAADAMSSVPTLAVLELVGAANWPGAGDLAGEPNLGSSSALLGLLAARITVMRPGPRRLAAALALGAGLAAAVAIERRLADVQHVLAVLAGAAVALASSQIRSQRDATGRAHAEAAVDLTKHS